MDSASSSAKEPMQHANTLSETSANDTTPERHGSTVDGMGLYMPLVHQVVSRMMRRLPSSVLRDDLVAAGTMGLLCAFRSNTHTCSEMFVAYARIRVQGAILDELRKHDWSPRRRRVRPEGAPPPAGAPTSEARPSPPVFVVRFDDLPEGASPFALPDEGASPLEALISRRERKALHGALETLPEREALVVRMRYFDDMPSKAIAAVMSVSEARVSQLNARATLRLRAYLVGKPAESRAA
jgi:RNA polymerase sigma factor FliA